MGSYRVASRVVHAPHIDGTLRVGMGMPTYSFVR